MSKFIKHIKKDGYKYFLEVLVLIIGIYGAFALESWNERRKEKATTDMLMKELVENLEYDIIRCEANGSRNSAILLGLDSLRQEIKRIDRENTKIERLYYFGIKYSIDYYEAVNTDAAFRELQKTGASRAFKDRELMKELVDYYERISYAMRSYAPEKSLAAMHEAQGKVLSFYQLEDFILAHDSIPAGTADVEYDYKKILMKENLSLRSSDPSLLESYYNAVAQYEISLRYYKFWLDNTRQQASALIQQIQSDPETN